MSDRKVKNLLGPTPNISAIIIHRFQNDVQISCQKNIEGLDIFFGCQKAPLQSNDLNKMMGRIFYMSEGLSETI